MLAWWEWGVLTFWMIIGVNYIRDSFKASDERALGRFERLHERIAQLEKEVYHISNAVDARLPGETIER